MAYNACVTYNGTIVVSVEVPIYHECPVNCHLHKLGVECKGNDDNIMCCDTLVV